MSIFKYTILGMIALIVAAILHYALPQVDVVRAIDAEIKRVDTTPSESGGQQTIDVSFIQTETLDGRPSVYRNQDNFLYGKFNSADLQAQVKAAAADQATIAVRHYGWRIPFMSMFPNAVKVWKVEPDYRHIPVFNAIVLLLLAGGVFAIWRRVKSIGARREARRVAQAAEREAREEAARAASASAAANSRSDIDDFLNDGASTKPKD